MALLTKCNIITILICAILTATVFFTRHSFDACAAPVHYFLMATFSSFALFIVVWKYAFSPTILNSKLKFYGSKVLFFLTWVLLVYVTVQGMIWQVQNMDQVPDCMDSLSWSFLILNILLIILDAFLFMLLILLVYTLRKAAIEQRRIREFQRQLAQLQGGDLQQFLVGMNAEEASYANNVGLSPAQISSIPKSTYLASVMGSLYHHDVCAICLANYEQGEKVLMMPGCDHIFHPNCAAEWLAKRPICPMCRNGVRKHI